MPTLQMDWGKMYYEVHGKGDPALVMGGWGTFCHGNLGPVPRSLVRDCRLVLFDYPGLGSSSDDRSRVPSTAHYADDVARLFDHLGLAAVHIVGMVGMGACVGQELAISRPDLVRSLAMAATWAKVDRVLYDQIDGLRRAFVEGSFEVFQLLAGSFSFEPEFYNANRDDLIGPEGAWSELQGLADAVSRIVDANLTHDTTERLHEIRCPTLVIHGGRDIFTGPHMTRVLEKRIPGAIGYEWPELAHIPSGGEQKRRFDNILADFRNSVSS